MTWAGFFTREYFLRGRPKKGYEFRKRRGKLLLQRHLADSGRPRLTPSRIRLPEDMKKDISISRIVGMLVSAPIRRTPVQLHIPAQNPPLSDGNGGSEKIRSWPVIPDAGMKNPDRLPRQGGQRIPDQLLEPDPLEDGFRQNRPRFLPKQVRRHPSPVSQTHGDKTGKKRKGCGLFLLREKADRTGRWQMGLPAAQSL